ncbi:MAG: hypothetical protein ACLPY1_12450 [Terracidiphilus sp.]
MELLIERGLKVADEVWIATALLHRENPSREDFAVEEIVERAREEKICEVLRPGVYIHAQMHCVANRAPNPGRYRMLIETRPGHRRLYCAGDPFDPRRKGSKTVPAAMEVPEQYRPLLEWYKEWCKFRPQDSSRFAALLALEGSGKDLWGGENADDYINRLREEWE